MFWSTFWGVVFLIAMVIFVGVMIVVAIGGIFDLQVLFRNRQDSEEKRD